MLKSAEDVGADELVFDLEDSVALAEKDRARDTLVDELNSRPYKHKMLTVRINPVTSPHSVRDLSSLVTHCAGRFDSVVIPKVESASDVEFALRLIKLLEADMEGVDPISVQILVESARGLVNLRNVVSASSERLAALVFGPGDYAGESAALSRRDRSRGRALPGPPMELRDGRDRHKRSGRERRCD